MVDPLEVVIEVVMVVEEEDMIEIIEIKDVLNVFFCQYIYQTPTDSPMPAPSDIQTD